MKKLTFAAKKFKTFAAKKLLSFAAKKLAFAAKKLTFSVKKLTFAMHLWATLPLSLLPLSQNFWIRPRVYLNVTYFRLLNGPL